MKKKLVLVVMAVSMFFMPTGSVYALTTTELYDNAVNNIFFYSRDEDECNAEKMAEYVATATGDQITWIGDAMSFYAQKVIQAKYPGVSLYAEKGRNFSETGAVESGLDLVNRLVDADSLRKFVVFMLGANGGNDKSEEEVKDMISKLVSAVGDDKYIVLMTPYTRTRQYENFGKAVEAVAKQNKKVLVADWAKAVKDNLDEYFKENSDEINNDGYNLLVAVVKNALDTFTDSTKNNASSTTGATLGATDSGSSVSMSATMEERAIYIAQRLRGNGYDGDAIAGILGNLRAESSLNPSVKENRAGYGGNVNDTSWKITSWSGYNKAGFGIAQWTSGTRQKALQDFADKNGLPVTSLEAQTGYLIQELNARSSVKTSALNGKGIEYATFQVYDKYEAPGSSFWTTHNGKHYNDYDPKTLDQLSESKTPSAYSAYNKRLGYAKSFLALIESNGIAEGSGIVWSGSGADSSSAGANGALCTTSAKGSADLAKLAVEMAWPNQADGTCLDENGKSHDFKKDGKLCKAGIKAKNKEVVQSVYGAGVNLLSKMQDCSHFIYALVKYSGLDNNWKDGSAPAWEYAQGAGKSLWTEIENIKNTSNLMPGDIFIYPHIGNHYGHVMIYVGEYGGSYGNMAGASAPDTVARVHNYYWKHTDTGAGDKFKIFRYNGTSSSDSSSNASATAGSCNYNSKNAEGCILYCQGGSESWASVKYGTGSCSTYASGGCGPTSLAMVIANLTGKKDVTPVTIGKKAVDLKARKCGNGSDGTKLIKAVKDYGLNYMKINLSVDSINQALSAGKVVWLSAHGSSPFSSNGHFVAIRGRTASGKWLLFNSSGGCRKGSYASSKKEYSPSALIKSISKTTSGPYAIWK